MKKISLKSVKESLSRKEMREISGGSGGWCGQRVIDRCGNQCSTEACFVQCMQDYGCGCML